MTLAGTVVLPPSTRDDSTVEVGNHASDHNKTAQALAAIIAAVDALTATVNALPAAGGSTDLAPLTARVTALENATSSYVTTSALAAAGYATSAAVASTYATQAALGTTNGNVTANGTAITALQNTAPDEVLTFTMAGNLTVKTGTARLPIKGGTFTIDSVAAMVGTAPTGASAIVDVNKNGTTIYGTAGNRPTIAAAGTSATVGANSVTSVITGDYLTVDVDQIGSTVAGADLTVVIRLKRTA